MKYCSVFFFIFILLSCSPSSKIKVRPLNPSEKLTKNSTIYALPLTTIMVKVEFIHTNIQAGPYAAFAEKYLNIKNAVQSTNDAWLISDINLETRTSADPLNYYAVSGPIQVLELNKVMAFSQQGMVISPINQFLTNSITQNINNLPKLPEPINYGYKSNFYEKIDTLYKTLFKDSVFLKIPLIKKGVVARSDEEKARDAAHFILKLRKRKTKMITADYEVLPEGIAMQAAIDEINRLEKEYLSLFIGTKQVQKFIRIFEVEPKALNEQQKEVLFRFDASNGLMLASAMQGDQVQIEITPLHTTGKIAEIYTPLKLQQYNNLLVYRIADIAEVSVTKGMEQLTTQKLPVWQLGSLAAIPIKYFNTIKGR